MLIADIRMPGMSGLELQAHLNAERCKIPIIFITGMATKKCGCKRCERALWSSWQNRSMTKRCSRVCERLWKAKATSRNGHRIAQGGFQWELLQDSNR